MALQNEWTDLSSVHHLLVDGREGYLEAAERVEDVRLKEILTFLGDRRTDLRTGIDRLVGHSERQPHRNGGSLNDRLMQACKDLRHGLAKSENAQLLAECARGEQFLIKRYETILERMDLDPRTRSTVQAQRAVVLDNVEVIQHLRKGFRKMNKCYEPFA